MSRPYHPQSAITQLLADIEEHVPAEIATTMLERWDATRKLETKALEHELFEDELLVEEDRLYRDSIQSQFRDILDMLDSRLARISRTEYMIHLTVLFGISFYIGKVIL